MSNNQIQSAPSCLLLGEPGRGKTFSLATLARHLKLFYLYTDPGGDESLLDGLSHYNIPITNVHWRYIPPAPEGWETLKELEGKVNTFNYESLGSLKSGINKENYRQYYHIIDALSNLKCQRTKETFGPADKLEQDWAIAFDSLTGLNKICVEGTVGGKPTLHQGEWGIAQSMEEKFIRTFVSSIRCTRVMVGHLAKTMVESEGRVMFSASLVGNKLAERGEIASMFSDIILATTKGKKFKWSTFDDRIALKSRNLPLDDELEPDFGQVLATWERRKKQVADAMALVPERE